jgi:hypothetical protein
MIILHNKAHKRIPFCGILSKFARKNQIEPIMKRIFIPFTILFTTLVVLSSCLNSDDDKVVYYDDTAITSFSLGTLNRTVHTVSSTGADSVYQTTLEGSEYAFYIDHDKREIYNADSLPCGTDVKHVICSITIKNGGTVGIKSMTSDSVMVYDQTDSLDFSTPRVIVVYAHSGKAKRPYTVHVNVHQEEAEVFNWSDMGRQDFFATMDEMKAVTCGDQLYTFGRQDGRLVAFTTAINDGKDWRQLTLPDDLSSAANAYQDVITKDGFIYLLHDGQVVRSANGSDWETIGSTDLRRLVAAGTGKIYGVSNSGTLMASADNGATWTEEKMDAAVEWLPEENINAACLPLRSNTDLERVVIVGNRNTDLFPNDSYAMVWGKVEDLSGDAEENGWMYYNQFDLTYYCLPRLAHLTMCTYDQSLIAFGGAGLGASTEAGFSKIYVSVDGGITWKGSSLYPLPEGLTDNGQALTAVVDGNNCLWIICNQSGQVWRGRLNRLGWTNIQKEL